MKEFNPSSISEPLDRGDLKFIGQIMQSLLRERVADDPRVREKAEEIIGKIDFFRARKLNGEKLYKDIDEIRDRPFYEFLSPEDVDVHGEIIEIIPKLDKKPTVIIQRLDMEREEGSMSYLDVTIEIEDGQVHYKETYLE